MVPSVASISVCLALVAGMFIQCPFHSKPTFITTPFHVTWLPLLLSIIPLLHLEDYFIHPLVFSWLLCGVNWWVRGLALTSVFLWELLERPPLWPDPALYVVDSSNQEVVWGYSLRGGKYVRHRSRSGRKGEGWVSCYTPTYTIVHSFRFPTFFKRSVEI